MSDAVDSRKGAMDWSRCADVESVPRKMSGAWVLKGTRVPADAVVENAGFDVMLTADRNIRYQQNLAGRRLAIVVVASSAWPVVRRNVDAIARAVSRARPGSFHEVSFDAAR